jgi:hypothetical protein
MRNATIIFLVLAAGYVYLSGSGTVSRYSPSLGQGGGAGIESYMNNSARTGSAIKSSASRILK